VSLPVEVNGAGDTVRTSDHVCDRDSVADVWGERAPYVDHWPARIDQHLEAEPDHWVQSCCVLCSNGCALDVGVKDGRIVGVRGREVDRVNHGRLGPKGLHGWIANASPDRLTQPLIRRDGSLQPATWDEAMGLVVERMKLAIENWTPGSIGFYNTGQLFLEEYYTLAVVAHGGIGTGHVDGNTRLCTATAAQALMESFGTDGAPGSLTDFDLTDAIALYGHNMASTQTVIWMRVLDRLAGPNKPKLLVVDPRRTVPAKHADVHLAPKPGTNLALLNGLLNQMIANGHVDATFVSEHTMGFEDLQRTVARYPLDNVSGITGIPVAKLEEAAELLGTTPTLVSTVLQGVYQQLQATASAVQVNNIHLLRGLLEARDWDGGDPGDRFEGIARNRALQVLEAHRVLADEARVDVALGDHLVDQPVQQREVGARFRCQVDVRVLCRHRSPRIHHEELRPVRAGQPVEHAHPDHRLGRGHVVAVERECVGDVEVGKRPRRPIRPEGFHQRLRGGRRAEAGISVEVSRSDATVGEEREGVVLLEEELARVVEADGTRRPTLDRMLHALDDQVHRVVPGRRL